MLNKAMYREGSFGVVGEMRDDTLLFCLLAANPPV
jgi:hypothetical protein